MTVAASAIVNRARDVLIDAGAVRWVDAELLRWVSDGQRAVVMAIPSASSTRATVALAAGTKQSIPNDGYILLSVDRNNVTGGTAPGRAVRIVSRELVENFNPDWHSATADPIVQVYVFDPNTPREYFVSPPNDGTGFVDLVYSKMPTELVAKTDNLSVDDIYQTPLVDYVLYRAFQKDSDYNTAQSVYQAKTLAQQYLDSFNSALGIKATAQSTDNPSVGLTDAPPTTPGGAK